MSQRVTTKHDIQKDEVNSVLVPAFVIGGRLSLVSATPVMTSSLYSGTSIYYTPYKGNMVLVYDGVSWSETNFSELTLGLDSNTGTTGFHQSGKNFDLFVYSDAGTLRLVSSPSWTSDTARSTALEYVNGILVNAASMTARYGSASGSVVTVARDCGTYVGTFRAIANGVTTWELGGYATGGAEARLYLLNSYNKTKVDVAVGDSTSSWTYTGTVIRPANNSNSNRISFLCEENDVNATITMPFSGGAAGAALFGISLDSTTAFTQIVVFGSFGTLTSTSGGTWSGKPGLGYHYLQIVEKQLVNGQSAQFFGKADSTQSMNFTASFLM